MVYLKRTNRALKFGILMVVVFQADVYLMLETTNTTLILTLTLFSMGVGITSHFLGLRISQP